MGLFFLTSRGSGVLPNASGSTPTSSPEEIRGLMSFFQIIDIVDGRLQRGSEVIVGGSSKLLE